MFWRRRKRRWFDGLSPQDRKQLESHGIEWAQTRYETTHGKWGDAVALWATELREKRERMDRIRFHAVLWVSVLTLLIAAATLWATLYPASIPSFFAGHT